jgi:hypothetical protein
MSEPKESANLPEEIKEMMEAHSRLVQPFYPIASEPNWSLEQPSPYLFVPSIITDSTCPTE